MAWQMDRGRTRNIGGRTEARHPDAGNDGALAYQEGRVQCTPGARFCQGRAFWIAIPRGISGSLGPHVARCRRGIA